MIGGCTVEYKPAACPADAPGLRAGAKTHESARRVARKLLGQVPGDWVARISRYTPEGVNQTLEFIPPSAKAHFPPPARQDAPGRAGGAGGGNCTSAGAGRAGGAFPAFSRAIPGGAP